MGDERMPATQPQPAEAIGQYLIIGIIEINTILRGFRTRGCGNCSTSEPYLRGIRILAELPRSGRGHPLPIREATIFPGEDGASAGNGRGAESQATTLETGGLRPRADEPACHSRPVPQNHFCRTMSTSGNPVRRTCVGRRVGPHRDGCLPLQPARERVLTAGRRCRP